MKKILVSLMIVLTGVVMMPVGVYAAQVKGVDAAGGSGSTSKSTSSKDSSSKSTSAASCEKNFLGFRPWYKGLTTVSNGKCEVKSPGNEDEIAKFVVTIILNILADLFVAAGYLVSIFIIKGGYNYITATGDPGKIAKAKKTIASAVIGLAIVIFANVIINLIVGALTASA